MSPVDLYPQRCNTGECVCIACRTPSEGIQFPAVEDLEYCSSGPVDFVRCAECRLITQNPSPPREKLASFYPANYRNYKPLQKDLLVFLKNLQADSFARRIVNQLNSNTAQPRILDIGFGNGQLLLALSRLGYRSLYGCDFNERDCDYLEIKGIKLAFCDIEREFPFDETFDCIILNNVVEHFLEPATVLQQCLAHLSDSGCVVLVTPNADAFDLLIFGRFWAGFHAPRHTYLFSEKSLACLSRTVGYTSKHTEAFCDPGQWAISIQNILQSTGLFRSALTMGLAWYTIPLSLLLAPLAWLQNFSGRSTAIMSVLRK